MALADTWRWDEAAFVLAWEAGVFGDTRVELIDGEVWPVAVGLWHGTVTSNLVRLLPADQWRITTASLAAAGSIPDPDVWVHPRRATPISRLGATGRLARWSPTDVALVVEVGDSTYAADVEAKARVYGRSGFATYWVVHRAGVDVMTDAFEGGYRSRVTFRVDDAAPVPYVAGSTIAVSDILDAED